MHTLAERTETEVGPAEVEAALLESYPALVRLAYLVLPSSLGRHRRVLAAHGVVQRAMPDRRKLERQLIGETSAAAYIRRKVLRDAVRQARARTPLRLLPAVWGFRLFPRSGAADDLVLDQAMSACTPEARAAWALVRIEHLGVAEAESELRAAGIDAAAAAIKEAAELDETAVAGVRGPLDAQVFDPCAVRLAPTDLMRRKARGRAVAIIVTIVLALILLASLALTAGRGQSTTQAVPVVAQQETKQLSVDDLRRSKVLWQDTARVDFTAWPVRGNRIKDRELLSRALNTWTDGTSVTSVAGAPMTAPTEAPQLLYAGDVDGAGVVLVHDGQRIARYSDRNGGKLVVARTDDADVTTSAAVAISESADGVRFLTAPWVAETGLRDLKKPDTPAGKLPTADGITAPVKPPTADCSYWPAMQLRSSEAIAEKHAFLVTYLGGLSPAHLTYMPPPSQGPARFPREATSGAALVSWSRTVCGLQTLQNKGVKAANNWTFAEQRLPDGTYGAWVCTRSDSWQGGGWASVKLFPAGLPAGKATNTAICSRFDQNVLATTAWRSPTGTTYLLAAGSRNVDRLTVAGKSIPGSVIALPGQVNSPVSAHVTTGDTIRPLMK
ncbi:hypothetical protein [Kribbella italica]|uniref:DNA-directed RNA polymerase specialized sigma24 family protein n=1 Tax=Kribbella italica TaxID=1540520 RepID=A0A7W9MYI3_9ACTN|nr:hypothetical protein [Kribbella italica]MBB5841186.1 hypothetical protein [Kribbella italica]